MLPYQMIAGGRFNVTVTGGTTATGVNVQCVSQNPPDFVIARSITGWGEASQAQAIQWWWERGMTQNSARGILQSSDATNPALTSRILPAAGGVADAISVFDTFNPPTFASLASTATTNANPAVVSMANTGNIRIGDIVRIYNLVNMQQISTYDFQVIAVTTNVSITLMLDASGFALAGTTGQVLKFIPNRMYPRWRWINSISRAAQAVVTFTVNNDFTPGEIISLRIPVEFGSGTWTSINNKAARVLSVTNTSTSSSVTLDLDTSGIASAFSFPTSAVAAAGVSPAVAVPASSGVVPFAGSATVPQEPPGTNLLDAFDNRNTRIIRFGADLFQTTSFVSTTGDLWQWTAFKYDDYKIGGV